MPQFGGASEKCNVCNKTVYLAEKIVVEDKEDKKTFHKTCLKCTHCKATLSLGNYASMNGVMYCKPHFKQLFATKGNYDEGFGKDKLTSKWAPNSAPASANGNTFVPVDKQEEAKSAEKKETPSSIASKFQRTTLNSEKCEKCSKTVYATEKIVIEEKDGKKLYHKGCLRCTHCTVVLTLGNYAAMGGVTYCKPHLKQLFATKGNYDEGFGSEKHTTKWAPQANTAPNSFVPVDKTDTKSTPPPQSSTSEHVASKFKNISASDKCDKCGKTVYLTEKIVVEDKEDKKLFHKSCLRCEHCQVVLSLGSYASMNGVTYCKPHFKQLFAVKGNFDEGFGKEKHTAKWAESNNEERDEEEPRHEDRHEEARHEEERRRDEDEEERRREEEEAHLRDEEEERRRQEEEERRLREEEEERLRRETEELERRKEEEERLDEEEAEERRRLAEEQEHRHEEEYNEEERTAEADD